MESLEAFRLYLLRAKGQKQSTVGTNLKLIKKILNEASPLSVETVTTLIDTLIEEERDVNYINQHIVVIRYYAEFKDIPDLVEYPYCKLKHRDDYVIATMSDEEVEAFLSIPSKHPEGSFYWNRDQMWTLFWYINAYEGFRMGETAKLRVQDIDFGRNVFILPDTKTGHRLVPISFVFKERLKQYTESLEGEYLFTSYQQSKTPYLRESAWQEDFRKRIKYLSKDFPSLARRANLKPYSLRHSFGTRQVDEDVSTFKIMKAMGHKKIETTQKYVHLSMRSVEELIENDRLSYNHKSGLDILKHYLSIIQEAESKHREKLYVNIHKLNKTGTKYRIDVEVID